MFLELELGWAWALLLLLSFGRSAFLQLLALGGLYFTAGVGDDFLGDLRELLEFTHLPTGARVAGQELQVLHDVLVEGLHEWQGLHWVGCAGLHCGKELLQFGGVHAQVHAM